VVQIAWDELPTSRDPMAYESLLASQWEDYYRVPSSTSVSPSFSNWQFDDDTYEIRYVDADETQDVYEAIQDAKAGYPGWLVELICESVYPEDTELARRFVRASRLKDHAILDDALDALKTYGPHTTLATLFDEACTEM